jgi:hypothetical protein
MGLNRMMMNSGVKVEDGSKKWSYREADNKTIAFTVPPGVKRIKVVAVVDYAENTEVYSSFYACIKNTINNIKWGEGISECETLENINHVDIDSIVGVTPNKTYTLHFDCYYTTDGVTFSWGKAINDITPTVEDY